MSEAILRVEGLSYRYRHGAAKALDTVSFSLQAGKFHALLGPNGAGKSTLFALLTGLFSPQSGCIEIFGHNIMRQPQNILARTGMVFQQSTLDQDLTVESNLRYHAALHGMSRARASQRIEQELAAFELSAISGKKVRALNGGHRRRLELARALIHEPQLLLLDEPSVGLDVASREKLNQRIHQLCAQRAITVLWTSHLIDEVLEGDQVILLDGGQIKACGAAGELRGANGAASLAQWFVESTGAAA